MTKQKQTTSTALVVYKPQQQVAKKKNRRRRKKKVGGKNQMRPDHLAHHLCSISNPFCPEAQGAKVPDENATPSCTYQDRFIYPIATDANGAAAYYISPNTMNAFYGYTTIAAGTVTVWAAPSNSTFYTTIGAACNQYRVVSYGFRYKTTAAWSTATGYIAAAEVLKNPTGANWVTGDMTTGLSNKMFPLRDAKLSFIGRPNAVEATQYQNYNGSGTNFYTGCVLSVVGGPASITVGYVEVIRNLEWTVATSTGYTLFATPAAKHNPVIMSARSNLFMVTDGVDDAHQTDSGWDENWIKKSIKSVGDTFNSALAIADTAAAYGPTALRVARLGGALLAAA